MSLCSLRHLGKYAPLSRCVHSSRIIVVSITYAAQRFAFWFLELNKTTNSAADNWFWYVSSAMQGWRKSASPILSFLRILISIFSSAMEDEVTATLKLDDRSEENAFFAVYDGHLGNVFSV
jgi:hypothetical protein